MAFYSDKHSVFRVLRRDAKGGQGMTQFGRALAELNVEILCANSSQAKGRVERANRTLQDRLVKELRLARISDVSTGNTFLPGFVERFNERFAIRAAKPDNLHRVLNIPPGRLNDTLCHREQRYVGLCWPFGYGKGLSLCRSRAETIPNCRCISFPASRPQLCIDQSAG